MPVRQIRYEKTPDFSFLEVTFKSDEEARKRLDELKILDQYCDLHGPTITLGEHVTPEELGTFLEGHTMIDRMCLAELRTDMQAYHGGPPRGGRGRRF